MFFVGYSASSQSGLSVPVIVGVVVAIVVVAAIIVVVVVIVIFIRRRHRSVTRSSATAEKQRVSYTRLLGLVS